MKKFNTYLIKKQVVILVVMFLFVLVACDDNSADPVSGDAATKYMSKNNTTTFNQEAWRLLTEDAKVPISDSTLILKREQPTITNNNLYTYLYKREDNPETLIRTENLVLESDKILIEFKRDFSFVTQNFTIDLKKIPLLDLSISAEKKYVDTTIKVKVDIKEIIDSPIPILINFDIKVTSQLTPNSTKELTIGDKSFKAKSFTNTINFTITSNDMSLQLLAPEYNNKLFASGSFVIETWFSETNNLGIIYQRESTLVKDELFSGQTMINTLIQRTAQNYK